MTSAVQSETVDEAEEKIEMKLLDFFSFKVELDTFIINLTKCLKIFQHFNTKINKN